MRDVILYGWLGQRYGKYHRLAVKSPAEAVRALGVLFNGFNADLRANDANGYRYRVYNGREVADERTLTVQKAEAPIRIVPVLQGGKRGGILQAILGVVLIVVGAYFGQSWAVSAGVGLLIGGVVQMLTPVPRMGEADESDANNPSTFFNGPVNTTAQGHPVPLAYGQVLVGSAVVSAGIAIEQIPVSADVFDPSLERKIELGYEVP